MKPTFLIVLACLVITLALLMIATNISVFPTPPKSSGLIDFGPFIGLWYLAVTIKVLFSYKWVKQKLK